MDDADAGVISTGNGVTGNARQGLQAVVVECRERTCEMLYRLADFRVVRHLGSPTVTADLRTRPAWTRPEGAQ